MREIFQLDSARWSMA